MIITEYNEQWDKEAEYKYGFDEGFDNGAEKKQLEIVKNLLKVKTPIEYIVAATGWNEEKILKLAEK
ncbi:MAG: hypothetical protein IKT98_01785 [Selenomonadaceae bacterium]|nr:hypothetical protein [Selenomonadaceae bacterium]